MADIKPLYASHFVEGLQVPTWFPAENIRSAMHYKPRPDDVILVTYPKCGTTWSKQILSLIFRKGVPTTASTENLSIAPFLEMTGANAARDMPRPGVIITHLPLNLMHFSAETKYIYVTRNPKDCCVSYYYHVTNMVGSRSAKSFDDFFEHFVSETIGFGDYFDHVLEWYEHKDDPNVLFVTYEEMKADPKAAVMKFASFLGKEYVDLLDGNPKVLEDIIYYSSFGYMKEKVVDDFDQIMGMDEETLRNDPHIPDSMKPTLLKISEMAKKSQSAGGKFGESFVRKGVVGDWRNHFSPEQNKKMNEKILQRLKGTELLQLWKDLM